MDEREAIIDQLVERWQVLRSEGASIAIAELCKDHPSVADEVHGRIDAILAMEPLLNLDHDAFLAQRELPSHIGPYEVVEEISRGAASVVYAALQLPTNRKVAVKVIHTAMLNDEALARFKVEAQALGRIAHPFIAAVYDAGIADVSGIRLPYIAMEFAPGVTLDRFLSDEDPTLAARVQLMRRIAEAVSHTHENGIIHRDLKPSNIMVTPRGDPKILDFGIARLDRSELGTITQAGHRVLGTIPYMSPEQLSGKPNAVDARSDIFSIGVIAYEAIAGKLPFSTDRCTVPEAIRLVETQKPRRLGELVPESGGQLELIVHRALESDVRNRYQSADELATDFENYLEGKPISSRPSWSLNRILDWKLRSWIPMALSVLVVSILLVGSVYLHYSTRDPEETVSNPTAQSPASSPSSAKQPSEQLQATLDLSFTNYGKARSLLLDEFVFPREERGFAWRLVESHLTNRQQTIVNQHPIRIMVSSPFANHLAIISSEGDARIWHPADANGQGQYLRATFDIPTNGNDVTAFGFSSFEKYFAVGLNNGDVVVLDGRRATLVTRIQRQQSPPVSLAFQDDHDLVVIDDTGGIEVYTAADEFAGPRSYPPIRNGEFRAAALTAQGGTAAVAFSDGHLEIRGLTVGKVFQFQLPGEPSTLAFKRSHQVYAVVGQQILEVDTLNNTIREIHSLPEPITFASPRADMKFAVACLGNVQILSADPTTIEVSTDINRIAFSSDKKQLFVQTGPNEVIVHQLANNCGRVYPGIASTAFAEIPSQEKIVFGGLSGELLIADRYTGKTQVQKVFADAPIQSLVVDEQRGVIAVAGNRLELWDLGINSKSASCELDGTRVNSLAFIADGSLCIATEDGKLGSWDGDNAATINWIDLGTGGPIWISHDGEWIASPTVEDGLQIRRLVDPMAVVHELDAASKIETLAFSPNGNRVAACNATGVVFVDTLGNEAERLVCRGEATSVTSLIFSPDGRTIAAAMDGSVLFWDSQTGSLQLTVRNSEMPYQTLSFTHDGRSLIGTTATETWTIWETK